MLDAASWAQGRKADRRWQDGCQVLTRSFATSRSGLICRCGGGGSRARPGHVTGMDMDSMCRRRSRQSGGARSGTSPRRAGKPRIPPSGSRRTSRAVPPCGQEIEAAPSGSLTGSLTAAASMRPAWMRPKVRPELVVSGSKSPEQEPDESKFSDKWPPQFMRSGLLPAVISKVGVV